MPLGVLAVTQAALLALVILTTPRGDRAANRLLAAIVLTIGAMIGLRLVVVSPIVVRLPHLVRVNHPFDFLPAPLFYLYVRLLTTGRGLSRRDLLHAVPAAACALFLAPHYARTGTEKLADLDSAAYQNWYFQRTALAIVIAAPYVLLAVVHSARYLKRRRGGVGHARTAVAVQLQYLSCGFAAILAIAATRYFVDSTFPQFMSITSGFLPFAGATMLCGMAYLGLRDPAMLTVTPAGAASHKYETSSLKDDRAARALDTLQRALAEERVYLDPELTLSTLAVRLKMPVPHLSQVINQRLNQNFTDLINGYRVEEAKRRLVDPAWGHYSIMAIAEDVGFRSKSSFNEVFKKHAQMTPSTFRRRYAGPHS
jgi:AraC-like DNA-binding protein